MLHYVCNLSITNKKHILYLLILYLNIDVSKTLCRSNIIFLNILRSLRKNVSTNDIMGTRINHRYVIEDLYDQIIEPYDIKTKVSEVRISYLTPDKIYGRIYRLCFDRVDNIIRVASLYTFPERVCEIYKDQKFLFAKEFERERCEELLNYTKKHSIMKSDYCIGGEQVNFYTERDCDIYLYSMRDGKRDMKRENSSEYYEDPKDIKINYLERHHNMNTQDYKKEMMLDDGRSIKMVGFREETIHCWISKHTVVKWCYME